MGRLAVLVENGFSIGGAGQFPLHTLTATTGAGVTDDPTGTESWRIATGRRSKFTNRYTSTATNTQILIPLTCDRPRTFDGFALYPDHNLSGITILLQCANESTYASPETAFSVTIPSYTMPGSLDDTAGIRTETGAWVKRFPYRAAKYWRLNIPALGAGVRPSVVGATLGNWWETDWLRPASEDAHDMVREIATSSSAWRGYTRGTRVRGNELELELESPFAYDGARQHVDGYFGDGFPGWICHDTDQPERTVLAVRNGPIRFELPTDYGYRRCRVPWIEHEAKAA